MALKTLSFYFCKSIRKNKEISWNYFCKDFARNCEKENTTWNIRCLVDGSFVPVNQRTSVLYCRLSDFYATAGYLVSCDLREQDWRIHFGRNIQILPKQDWKWVQSKTVSAWAGPGPGKFWKFLIKFSWQNIRSTKAELLQLIRTQFLLVKKLEIEKTKTSFVISVVLVFGFPTFLLTKFPREGKSVRVVKTKIVLEFLFARQRGYQMVGL